MAQVLLLAFLQLLYEAMIYFNLIVEYIKVSFNSKRRPPQQW